MSDVLITITADSAALSRRRAFELVLATAVDVPLDPALDIALLDWYRTDDGDLVGARLSFVHAYADEAVARLQTAWPSSSAVHHDDEYAAIDVRFATAPWSGRRSSDQAIVVPKFYVMTWGRARAGYVVVDSGALQDGEYERL